jgi:hypothetical protein
MPPRCRNHRDPTGPDTPTATAASSLVKPSAFLTQNARSTSGRGGGRPGDRIGARPVFVDIHAAVCPIVTPLLIGVLRRPLESAQFASWAFTDRAKASGLLPSMGSIGDCFDNSMIEAFWSRMQVELLDRRPWKTRLELANASSSTSRSGTTDTAGTAPWAGCHP